MNNDFLKSHRFQFITYGYIYHKDRITKSFIQVNDDSHIIHIIKGTGNIYINSETYALKKGTVIAIPPFVDFYFDIDPDFEMQNIHYRIWLENGELLDDYKALPLIFSPDYFEHCLKILNKMKKYRLNPSANNIKLPALAHEIILSHLSLNKLSPSPEYFADDRINKVYKLLQSLDCIKYDAAKMSKRCFLSVSQMNRKFKYYFKISPHKFWEKNRFKFISKALRNKSKSLAEIANDFSFTDQTYFSKWFKKIAGYSPAVYREMNADENKF